MCGRERKKRQRGRHREPEEEEEEKDSSPFSLKTHLRPAPALDAAHVLVDQLGAVLEVVDSGLLVALFELLAEELVLRVFGVFFFREVVVEG